ncbi:MAG: UDP-N-acetylglucosamine 2-epimerase [Candidatus Paceibacterota bacterium]|jgi:UDP-hydrolysing UDP-N-acetyl-D-glucosamine 2-epimerase
MDKKKILYISGTRADYGLMRQTLFEIEKSSQLDLEVVATGMHLMKEFGYTVEEISRDGHKVTKIQSVYDRDDRESMANFIGDFIKKFTKKIVKIDPKIILIIGDRSEMLAAAVVGAYFGIPVAHLHGGDVTSTIDDIARHAITKLSHIHLPATQKGKERILKLGEESWRIQVVGAPGLDAILNSTMPSKKEVCLRLKLNPEKPILVILQHPVTAKINEASNQIISTLDAVKELREQMVVIYPNADAGGREMIKAIEKYREYPFIKIFKNIEHDFYLGLMDCADILIGNSSSGIIEAPSLHLPVVNIGSRQEGRERGGNVIEVGYNKEEIALAIKFILHSEDFKKKVQESKNPYGDGHTSQKIVKVLEELEISERLLQKKITY